MNPHENDRIDEDMDATQEQLAELRRLGVPETDLVGLSSIDAEELIDELRMKRIDAGKFRST